MEMLFNKIIITIKKNNIILLLFSLLTFLYVFGIFIKNIMNIGRTFLIH